MTLAAELYEARRRKLEDPSSLPAWGNAPTEERLAWEAVAEAATVRMPIAETTMMDFDAGEARISQGEWRNEATVTAALPGVEESCTGCGNQWTCSPTCKVQTRPAPAPLTGAEQHLAALRKKGEWP